MGTSIRRNLSTNSRYYISKHRRLELEHFCLQYPEWIKELNAINVFPVSRYQEVKGTSVSNPTLKTAYTASLFREKIAMLEKAAAECDDQLGDYILEAVTTGKTFSYFEAHGIPCCRDTFYDRLRKFYYILSRIRM